MDMYPVNKNPAAQPDAFASKLGSYKSKNNIKRSQPSVAPRQDERKLGSSF